MKMYRQGDVLLLKVDEIPEKAIKGEKEDLAILAYGEKTGHMHAIKSKDVDRYIENNNIYIEICNTVILSHGLKKEIESKVEVGRDHAPVKIPPGNYKIIIQREYTPEKIRRVVD